jgi:hypothetical protein
MAQQDDLEIVHNFVSEAHLLLTTTTAGGGRIERAQDLLHSAIAILDSLMKTKE